MVDSICFISDKLYSYLNPDDYVPAGGAERQQFLISQQLLDRGYEVSAVVGDYGQQKVIEYQGINTIRGCPSGLKSIFDYPSNIYNLYHGIKKADADVYYVRGAPRLFVASCIICKVLNKKLVFCIANDSDLDREYLDSRYGAAFNRLYYQSLLHVDQIIAQTTSQKNKLVQKVGRSAAVIPNGYDVPPQSTIIPHADRKYFLWVGRSHPDKKQPHVFLKVASQLPSISFVMISQPAKKPDEHAQVKSRAESLNNVDFHEFVNPDDIHKYYQNAIALINTSKYEGFPNTFLEAWRSSTPVVSLYFSLDGEIERYNIGILSQSIEHLRCDVIQLEKNKKIRKRLGENARDHFISNYSLLEVSNKYERLLMDL